jgi:histidine triad (HIT) family protein
MLAVRFRVVASLEATLVGAEPSLLQEPATVPLPGLRGQALAPIQRNIRNRISRMKECVFCRIIDGTIPAAKVHEDTEVVAFKDLNPQAPLHVLIVPRRHIATLNDLQPSDDGLVGTMVRTAADLARAHGYDQRGYRTVFNCNREAGQTVFHIHLHLLAGRGLTWPPG